MFVTQGCTELVKQAGSTPASLLLELGLLLPGWGPQGAWEPARGFLPAPPISVISIPPHLTSISIEACSADSYRGQRQAPSATERTKSRKKRRRRRIRRKKQKKTGEGAEPEKEAAELHSLFYLAKKQEPKTRIYA